MYENFYGFSEKPFNVTPDSKFFFASSKHSEALNSLIYAINERKGFVVITGEIGAGKTTVSRTLINKLDANTKVALITNSHLTPRELIAEILDEFEIENTGGTKQKLVSKLNAWLIRQLAEGINVVLIIDEAQNLTPKVLEEVRMLSNLETEREKMIQIILMGQPQLRKKLEDAKLEQFRQRISVYYHLYSLNKEESRDYILHRLKLVNSNGSDDIFERDAITRIYEYSKGIPRLINLLCDSALLSGYIYETKRINSGIIEEVINERDFEWSEGSGPDRSNPKVVLRDLTLRKTFCCPDCQIYSTCKLKWDRGIKGKEQLCCTDCRHYKECLKNGTGPERL
jgi:general secretion pathway protein A